MKNRKMIVVAFLVAAMLVVGVGYAALTGHLSLEGSASFSKTQADSAFIQNITFSNPQVTEHGEAYNEDANIVDVAAIDPNDATVAQFTVKSLAAKGEKVVFTYTLTNNNTVDAKLTISSHHEDSTANPTEFTSYDVVVGFGDTKAPITPDSGEFTLGAGEETTVTVTVSLKATPSTDIAKENYFLHVIATSVDANS